MQILQRLAISIPIYMCRARGIGDDGRKLTVTERRELFAQAQAEAEEAKVRRERHAAETGTSTRLWK